jgi:hypothetical protein
MGIHLLHCAHGNEHIKTHDAIHNTFVAIAWDVGFYVGRKKLDVLPSITFNSSHWRIDIVFTKYNIRILAIVIVDPIWMDLFLWSCVIQGFVASNATQAKERSYLNWHPTNQFIPLVIEVFDYLHKHADVFL